MWLFKSQYYTNKILNTYFLNKSDFIESIKLGKHRKFGGVDAMLSSSFVLSSAANNKNQNVTKEKLIPTVTKFMASAVLQEKFDIYRMQGC